MCILDPKIDRNRGRRRAGIVSCIVIAAVIVPLSISGVWRTQAQAQEKSDKEKKEAELKQKEMMLKEKELQLQKKMENMTPEEQEKFKKELELKKQMESMSAEEKTKFAWEKISQNKNSAAVHIHDAIEKKGLKTGEHLAQELAESKSADYYFKESEINTLGYLYLFAGKLDAALSIFELNVRMNPESWNVYDSLGEGCLAAGKFDCARKQYQKSLALNPDNENGKKMLSKIDEQEKGAGKVSTVSKEEAND